MKKSISIFLGLLFITSFLGAQMAFKDGNKLYEVLKPVKEYGLKNVDPGERLKYFMGFGYILGVFDGIGQVEFLWTEEEKNIPKDVDLLHPNMPSNVTANQIVDVVYKYLDENPQDRNHPACVTIYVALLRTFSLEENKEEK